MQREIKMWGTMLSAERRSKQWMTTRTVSLASYSMDFNVLSTTQSPQDNAPVKAKQAKTRYPSDLTYQRKQRAPKLIPCLSREDVGDKKQMPFWINFPICISGDRTTATN